MSWRWVLVVALGTSAHADELPDPSQISAEKNPPPPKEKRLANIPAALTSAKPWIGRRYMTGMVPMRRPHETFTLQHDGTQALLTHEVRVASQWRGGLDPQVLAWRTESLTQYLGTVEEKGGVMKLALANGSETLELSCKKAKVSAARHDAVRVPSSRANEECGDKGKWSPATTKKVSVYHCTNDATDWDQLAFAAAPGIEWLFVNDDCVIQGGGWRVVPADGSIAEPKPRDKPVSPSKQPTKKR